MANAMVLIAICLVLCGVSLATAQDFMRIGPNEPLPTGYRNATCFDVYGYQATVLPLTLMGDICNIDNRGGVVWGNHTGVDKNVSLAVTCWTKVPAKWYTCRIVTRLPVYPFFQIQSTATKRYILDPYQGGSVLFRRGWEGDYASGPRARMSDKNYNYFANWYFSGSNGQYVIENLMTRRYLLDGGTYLTDTGEGMCGAEGGWSPNQQVVTADSNYYNMIWWKLIPMGNNTYLIQHMATKRFLLDPSGTWRNWGSYANNLTGLPILLSADANYRRRAVWKIAGFPWP